MDFKELIKDEDELELKFNSICKTHLAKKHLLCNLTLEELFIWIVGKTYIYGRTFKDSIENAECHFKKPRKEIEKLFSTKERINPYG